MSLNNIKKENIGLIEVMGLAVLPAQLKQKMELLSDCLSRRDDSAADRRDAFLRFIATV